MNRKTISRIRKFRSEGKTLKEIGALVDYSSVYISIISNKFGLRKKVKPKKPSITIQIERSTLKRLRSLKKNQTYSQFIVKLIESYKQSK